MNAYIEDVQYSVLTAPLAQIDRRALSQAWISALHLSGAPSPRSKAASVAVAKQRNRSPLPARGAPQLASRSSSPMKLRILARVASPVLAGGERRSSQSSLARRIVQVLLAPRNTARRCSLALGDEKGRLHLLLGGGERRLHIVALCLPKVRAEVARALHEVRFALAARGILATSDLREFAA